MQLVILYLNADTETLFQHSMELLEFARQDCVQRGHPLFHRNGCVRRGFHSNGVENRQKPIMAHAVRRRTGGSRAKIKPPPVFRINRIHSCRNFVGKNTKYQRSNLKTEIVMRKEKLTPEKMNAIKETLAKLSPDDIEVLTLVFEEGDSTWSILRSLSTR